MRKNFEKRKYTQSGQIGIIIILIMIVLLTIGLSLASRSSRETTLSTQEDESTRTFNAAEAGVDQALSVDLTFNGQQYHPTPTALPGANAVVDYSITKENTLSTRIFEGVGAHVQLTDSSNLQTAANVVIDWGQETACSAPGPATLIVSIFNVDTTVNPHVVKVRHYAYAACDHSDGIAVAGGAGNNGYFREVTIALQPKDAFMFIRPIYNDTNIQVAGTGGPSNQLPVQYYNVVSSAKNQSGNETRTVQVNRTLATEPSVLDYVIFSGTTATQ